MVAAPDFRVGEVEVGGAPGRRRRGSRPQAAQSTGRRIRVITIALLLTGLVFVGFGGAGVIRYVETFWLYRGFAAPRQPVSVVVGIGSRAKRVPVLSGTVVYTNVVSPALGGRSVPVIVYLPPDYGTDLRTRYPVFYLLHGSPGSPKQFIDVGDLATVSNTLIAEGEIHPMICVMPSGSFNFLVDEEWANTIEPDNQWETFVQHDLVNAINARYRTLGGARSQAIGGLSEGGYGALNIGFHHVGEFGLLESWSGYYKADKSPGLFGDQASLLAYNSPALELPLVAQRLIATHTYIWMYDGEDEIYHGAKLFTAELANLHVDYSWRLYPGTHDWGLWRHEMPTALIAASNYFAHGAPPLQ